VTHELALRYCRRWPHPDNTHLLLTHEQFGLFLHTGWQGMPQSVASLHPPDPGTPGHRGPTQTV